MTDLAEPGSETPERPRWQTVLIRVGIGLAILSVLPWLWAIAQTTNRPDPDDYLQDRRFPESAEPICAAAVAQLEAFPPAQDAETPEERAEVIRATSAVLSEMTDELRLVVPEGDDQEWIVLWIDDWNVHIEDRVDFAERLEQNGDSEEFLETTKADTQLSRSLDRFATVNLMESCQTPGDV